MANQKKVFRKITRFLAVFAACFLVAGSIRWLRTGDFTIGRGDKLLLLALALVGSEFWVWARARKRRKLLAKSNRQPETGV